MKKVIGLRSDTITLPTKEMMEAIQQAKLGDDVTREDPTVNKLEEMAAEIFGKEAGLLVTSGTQGNLIGTLSQTDGRGSEIILEKESHMVYYEVGSIAALGGVMIRTLKGEKGYLNPSDVEMAIRPENIHFPKTSLVAIENTHNRAGGVAFSTDQMTAIGKVAQAHGIGYHVDGARIFNAAIAKETTVKELTKTATSVTFCLSKGLSCPIGSVLVGSEELINKARKIRKMLGGGMRQAGIIAAPGIVALKNINRLKEDHDNAKLLAKGINAMKNEKMSADHPDTNIVMVNTTFSAYDFQTKLEEKGVKVYAMSSSTTRFVTHRMISQEDIEETLRRIEELLKGS